jgi:hypothetical protein
MQKWYPSFARLAAQLCHEQRAARLAREQQQQIEASHYGMPLETLHAAHALCG